MDSETNQYPSIDPEHFPLGDLDQHVQNLILTPEGFGMTRRLTRSVKDAADLEFYQKLCRRSVKSSEIKKYADETSSTLAIYFMSHVDDNVINMTKFYGSTYVALLTDDQNHQSNFKFYNHIQYNRQMLQYDFRHDGYDPAKSGTVEEVIKWYMTEITMGFPLKIDCDLLTMYRILLTRNECLRRPGKEWIKKRVLDHFHEIIQQWKHPQFLLMLYDYLLINAVVCNLEIGKKMAIPLIRMMGPSSVDKIENHILKDHPYINETIESLIDNLTAYIQTL